MWDKSSSRAAAAISFKGRARRHTMEGRGVARERERAVRTGLPRLAAGFPSESKILSKCSSNKGFGYIADWPDRFKKASYVCLACSCQALKVWLARLQLCVTRAGWLCKYCWRSATGLDSKDSWRSNKPGQSTCYA
eukprot:2979812-Pleurochrysis_carterae.AAC.3